MDSRGTFAIINPAAANGRAAERWRRGFDVNAVDAWRPTTLEEGTGHLLREAVSDGYGTILVCGGDGTVNEAVNAILAVPEEQRPVLGVLSAGTANDFARAVGHNSWDAVLAASRTGCFHHVDVGVAEGAFGCRAFTVAAFVGAPALVAKHANAAGKRLHGLAGYLPFIPRAIRYRAPLHISCEGLDWRGTALAVVVTNTPNGAGGIPVCPGADMADGLADVLAVESGSVWRALRVALAVLRGRHMGLPGVFHTRTACVSLTGEGVELALDGEIVGTLPAEIRILPRALKVVAP